MSNHELIIIIRNDILNGFSIQDISNLIRLKHSSRKIIVLHGGGSSGSDMRNLPLILGLTDYEFVFADSPVTGGIWYEDPPNGKNNPTTDPNWANLSITYLDSLIATHGGFYGIIAYSQGCPMATVYLTHNPNFVKVLLFNGYLPTTHTGLLNKIDDAAPFSNDTLVFSGEYDDIISKEMSDELASKFTNLTRIHSTSAGHNLPLSSDSTFDEIVQFLT